MTRDEYTCLFHETQANLVAFKRLMECDDAVIKMITTAVARAKKEWVGLTEEEFESILERHNEAFPFNVYKSIEAKLKEKNGG